MSTPFADIAAKKRLSGRQSYFVDVPGAPTASALSVVSCRIVERMGEPWRITVDLTHPEALSRKDYLGRDATFTLAPEGGEPSRSGLKITWLGTA